jgi:hypothetical protein
MPKQTVSHEKTPLTPQEAIKPPARAIPKTE